MKKAATRPRKATTPVLGPHVAVGSEGSLPLKGDAKHSTTYSPSIGVGGPVEGHSLVTYTAIKVLYSSKRNEDKDDD